MLGSSQMYFVPDDVSVPCVRRCDTPVFRFCTCASSYCIHFSRSMFSFPIIFQRVRHSEATSGDKREFTLMQDMICTMRVWQKVKGQIPCNNSPNSNNNNNKRAEGNHRRSLSSPFDTSAIRIPASEFRNLGPELVLTPLSTPLLVVDQQQQHLCCGSDFANALPTKFGSCGVGSPTAEMSRRILLSSSGGINAISSNSQHHRRASLVTVTIPLRDILLVGVSDTSSSRNNNNSQHHTNVTTVSAGFYELTMDNVNGQLVMMAFLRANLPKSKLCDLNENLGLPRSPSNMTQTTQSTKSFDVEAFTATRMTERLQSESVAEKVQRRIHRLLTSLEESEYQFPF
jgi:hypothetical protein